MRGTVDGPGVCYLPCRKRSAATRGARRGAVSLLVAGLDLRRFAGLALLAGVLLDCRRVEPAVEAIVEEVVSTAGVALLASDHPPEPYGRIALASTDRRFVARRPRRGLPEPWRGGRSDRSRPRRPNRGPPSRSISSVVRSDASTPVPGGLVNRRLGILVLGAAPPARTEARSRVDRPAGWFISEPFGRRGRRGAWPSWHADTAERRPVAAGRRRRGRTKKG